MSNKLKILLAEDDPSILIQLSKLLRGVGYYVECVKDGLEALMLIDKGDFDIIIADLEMPKMGGLGLLAELRTRMQDVSLVVLSASGTIETAVHAIKNGAHDYIEKPIDPKKFLRVIEGIDNNRDLWLSKTAYEDERRKSYRFENIIGFTPQMHKLFDEIAEISKTDASVLIIGENGTGKELVADAIHYRHSKGTPYTKINCGAIPENLVESELFGHEKGAFTGAMNSKKGQIELAHQGTLFLDEVGEFPKAVQVKLLRVLDSGEYQKVGGMKTLKSNFRLISATNRNLTEAVLQKEFREDLFYRINTVTINLPTLRERQADIPLLADYFLKRYSKKIGKNIKSFSKEVIRLFINYEWPGNVRELAHTVERSVIYCRGLEITAENLPEAILKNPDNIEITIKSPSKSFADVEASLLYNVLLETNWNIKRAAKTLDLSRGTLYSKMDKCGIQRPQ